MTLDDNATLRISADLRALLDERGIRDEDLLSVLAFAENGRRFHISALSGRRLAYFTPHKVTFWVEYQPAAGGYEIYNAYSHRMRILHGFNMAARKTDTATEWLCAACERPLATATVKLAYLDETFAVDLAACPACQRVLVSEEQAIAKMALAERMLEDK